MLGQAGRSGAVQQPPVRLLGLDPGLRHTGWGVIDVSGNRLTHVADGAVHSDGDRPLAERLCQIHDALSEVLERYRPDEAAQMNLAIFYDAAAVAGDETLLAEAKGYLLGRLQDNQMFFTAFARPALAFDAPSGLFGGLFERRRNDAVDIKKAGIFPIVHGVRALALETHMAETNTTERIWALADKGVLDRAMAGELADAFAFLSTLRLKAGVGTSLSGTQTDNFVHTETLGKLDRDQFKDCLALVKKFKELLAYHFHLNH